VPPPTLAGALALVALAVPAPAGAAEAKRDGADANGPLDLRRLALEQDVRNLVLDVKTTAPWQVGALTRYPRSTEARGQRFLCLILRAPKARSQLLCPGEKGNGLGRSLLKGDKATRDRAIPARVERPNKRRLKVSFRSSAVGLSPGRFSWSVVSGWSGEQCTPESPPPKPPEPPPVEGIPSIPLERTKRQEPVADQCLDRSPHGERSYRGRLLKVRIAGCDRGKRGPVQNGPRRKKLVALTFDDGPGPYTPRILKVLEDKRAKGTFFALGALIRSRAGLMTRAVARGHELANHTWRHNFYPSYFDLRATSRVMRRSTGFEPCSFRPPGRAYNRGTVSSASRLGMTTVLWDVDTRDWTNPGSEAIYSTAVNKAKPGSIILLHDGGGYRGQTVSALPRIISTLRSRGYRFVTVSRLLGGRPRYVTVR
jgi:peptidoglycan/xylan/chitin deacetylase (PgdA/CDA1 family)